MGGSVSEKKIAEFVCNDWANFRRILEEKIYKQGFFVMGEFLYRGQGEGREDFSSAKSGPLVPIFAVD